MAADVEVNQGFTVEAVGQVCHVHTVQSAVGQFQTLKWSVEGAVNRAEKINKL